MSLRETIEAKIRAALSPVDLRLVNESPMHNVPPGAESHWNLIVVSSAFEGRGPVDRHRQVYGALGEELRGAIHALTLKTLTPAEWQALDGRADNVSPPCMGGSKG